MASEREMEEIIDDLIAEHVFGLTPIYKEGEPGPLFDYGPSAKKRPSGPDNYSTNIADAWEVVEKMRDDQWNIVLYDTTIPNSSGCVVYKYNENFAYLKVGAKVPKAICLAALKAKGVEVEG